MPDDTVLLERHFDTSFAVPDGIQKLRELILTLAMQGKLVPQDPKDQPASELLKAIAVEKQQLVKEGTIRQPKSLPKIKSEEVPYEVPSGWNWVRLEDISTKIHYGYTASANHDLRNVRLLRITDIQDNKVDWESVPGCEIKEKDITQYLLADKDILIARTGGTVGKSYLVENISVKAVFASYLIRVVPSDHINVNCLKLFIESPLYWRQLYAKCSGTGQPNVNGTSLSTLLLPLPPLNEQSRIVAKIDRLMARCDELEKLRAERNQKRITIHTAALDRLLNAKESDNFSTAWRFITQHFGELYSVKENVAELRKAILQLAVMGKLVPQDPTDEPASELLRAIEAEKQQLVKEGKIKQPKPLPEIKLEDEPYELPQGWVWVRLGNVSQIIGGFAYKSDRFQTEGTRQVLRLGNIRPDLIRLNENPVFIDDSIGEATSEFCLLKNDILITMTGTRSKRDYLYTVRVEENPMNGVLLYLNQRVGAIRLFFDARYINLGLKVERLKDVIFSSATGSANQANIGISNLREWMVPLPPLAEQRRIASKIDQLMALCDELDQQIDAATSKQTDLLNAVMAQI